MTTPAIQTMQAIHHYLSYEKGYLCEWQNPTKFHVKSKNLGELFAISYIEGDIMIMRAGIKTKSQKVNLDLGAQILELANPKCFDQIVDALEGKTLPINSQSVFDGGNWLIDG